MATAEHIYPADHQAVEGHFPGNPLIPGAVLLSDTLRTIEASIGRPLTLSGIKSAKFHSPTRPGDRVAIEFALPAAGQIKFTCAVGGTKVLTGEAVCVPTSTAS